MILFIHTSDIFSFLHPFVFFTRAKPAMCPWATDPPSVISYRKPEYILQTLLVYHLCWGTKCKLVLQLLAVFGSSCEVASQPDKLRSNQITFQIASLSSKGQDYSDADDNNNKTINTISMNIYPKYTRLFFFSLQSLSFRETYATNICYLCATVGFILTLKACAQCALVRFSLTSSVPLLPDRCHTVKNHFFSFVTFLHSRHW